MDELEARVMRLVEDRDGNPVVQPIIEASLAMLRLRQDVSETQDIDDMARSAAIYKARVARAIVALHAIPDNIWKRWCEMEKHRMIAGFTEAFDLRLGDDHNNLNS